MLGFLDPPSPRPTPKSVCAPSPPLPACQLGTGCSSVLRAPHPPNSVRDWRGRHLCAQEKACRCKPPSSQEQRSARSGFLFCFGLSHGPALSQLCRVLCSADSEDHTHPRRSRSLSPSCSPFCPLGGGGGLWPEQRICLSRKLGGL